MVTLELPELETEAHEVIDTDPVYEGLPVMVVEVEPEKDIFIVPLEVAHIDVVTVEDTVIETDTLDEPDGDAVPTSFVLVVVTVTLLTSLFDTKLVYDGDAEVVSVVLAEVEVDTLDDIKAVSEGDVEALSVPLCDVEIVAPVLCEGEEETDVV